MGSRPITASPPYKMANPRANLRASLIVFDALHAAIPTIRCTRLWIQLTGNNPSSSPYSPSAAKCGAQSGGGDFNPWKKPSTPTPRKTIPMIRAKFRLVIAASPWKRLSLLRTGLIQADLLHPFPQRRKVPVFFLERRLKFADHIVLPQFPRQFDQQSPPIVVDEFGDMNGMETLGDRHTGVGDDLHESKRGNGVRIAHGRDGSRIGAELEQGIPTQAQMGSFFGSKLLELIDRQRGRLIFSRQKFADQGVVQARAGSLERQTPGELVAQHFGMTSHEFLH